MKKHMSLPILSFLSLVFFIAVTILVINGKTSVIDAWIYKKVAEMVNPWIYNVMIVITNLASVWVMPILYLFLIWYLYATGRKKIIPPIILFAGGGTLALEILRYLIAKPRPTPIGIIEIGFSFPSGHTFASVIFFGLIAYLFKENFVNKASKNFFMSVCAWFAGIIGISRIYLGVHWTSDVAGSLFFGLFWVIATAYFIKFLGRRKLRQSLTNRWRNDTIVTVKARK